MAISDDERKKRRAEAFGIMKGNISGTAKPNQSGNARRATAYAIMNQNTRNQRAEEQAKIENQQELNNLSNLAFSMTKIGVNNVIAENNYRKRKMDNSDEQAYLTLKMAEANSGKVPVNYIPYSKSSPIDPSWSVVGSDKIDFSNDDYWIYDSGETLENFTPLNEAERKRYLEVTKIDGVKISGNLDENVKVLGNININDRNARIRALSYAYQSGDITTEEQNELVSLLSIGTEADQKRVDEAVKNNTLDTFKPENLAQERLYKKAVEKERETKTADKLKNISKEELKSFTPNSSGEAKALYEYVNAENFSSERNTATGELIGADEYAEIYDNAVKYAVKYGFASTAEQELYYSDEKVQNEIRNELAKKAEQEKKERYESLNEKEKDRIDRLKKQLEDDSLSTAEKSTIIAKINQLLSVDSTIEEYDESKIIPTYVDGKINEELPEDMKDEIEETDFLNTHSPETNFLHIQGNTVLLGLEEFFLPILQGLNALGDATIGAVVRAVTGEDFEPNAVAKWIDRELDSRHNKVKTALMKYGASEEKAEISTMLASNVVQVIPQVALSLIPGVGSAASGAGKLSNTTSALTKVTNGITKIAKNPMFWTTFVSEFGDTYYDAKENNASQSTATSAATMAALINSIVEMGGIESGEQSVLKMALGEGMEEIYQGVSSNIIAKAMYAPDIPLISTDGSDAVFNCKELALSFLGGMVGGAAGGGMVKGINYKFSTAQQYKTYGDNLKTNTDILQQYADIALEQGSNRDVKTANEIISSINEGQLDNIPSVKVGRFAQNAAKIYQNKYIAVIAQEESGANIKEKTKSASEIYNTLQNIYTNPEFILNDTRAIMIRKNKVAAEALSRSAGLNSTINAETPVSTVKTIARMVSNGVNVNNNQSINVDSTGRVSSTVTPTQIDIEAAQRIKNGNGSLSDYLSVTGKTLNDYRDSEGEVNASALSREAHEIIENSDVLTNTENNRLTEILNSRRLLNSHGENNISVNNISGFERVAPQNIVEIKDGNITLDNGRTVSAESVPFTAAAKALYTASARYKDNTKAVFISGFEGGNLNNYIKNFSNVYDIYAMKSKLTDAERYKSVNAFKQILGEKVFNAARQAGIEARNERETAKSRQNEQKATESKKNEGKNKSSQKGSESKRKYSIKNPTYTQDDLKNNAIAVRNMKSVKNLKGNEFDGNGKLSYRIDSYFAKLGNNVYSEELGDVALSKASRRSEIRHGRTRTKIASYAAVPEVIQNGKVIAIVKKENIERVVVAAPIKINNESYYMGVMLQRDERNQRLYLHDVITEKETTISAPEFLITQTGANAENDNLYMTRILQKALNVNNSISKKAKNDTKKDLPQNKNTVNASMSEDSEIRLSEKEKNTTIIEQLKQAKDKLDKMSPVIEVNENREFKTNIEKIEFFENVLHAQDNKIYRQGFGEVVIGKNQYKKALAYLKTHDEIISFAAVPKVIETGVKIGEHLNHKDRGYSTTTFGAKIRLNGQSASIAVVVKQTNKNYYKVHRVLMSDDSVLEFIDNKKEELETARVAREKTRVLSKPTNSSNNSISQNKNTVNASMYEKASKKGVITESYKEEWVLDRKDKATESVIKQIAYEYTKRGINVEIAYVENGHNGQWNPKTNTVIVNLAANNPIEAFLHEATGHVIHDYANENWQDIKTAAFTYLASIKDVSIDDIRNHKIDQYKKNKLSYTDELIDEEIVSDMIGVMAQDKNSVKELYNSLIQNGTEETLAQRIVRKLKELLMKLKLHFVNLNGRYNSAISKVAKENRPSDNAFSEYLDKINSILSQSFENLQVTEDGDAKYSIKYTTENKPVVVIEENILEDVPKNEWIKTVKGIMSEKFSDGIPISGRLIKVNAITRNEFTNSKNSKYYRGHNRTVYADKFKSANNLDEIVLASTNYVNEDLMHERKDNFKEFARGDVLIRVGDNDYSAKVVVGFTSGREMVLYDVIDFKSASFSIKKVGAHTVQSQNAKNRRNATPTNNNISQNDTVVNNSISENGENDTRFSIRETDSGEKIVVVDTDQGIFLNTDEKEQIKIATKYMNDNFKNKHLPLSDYNVVVIDKTGINKYRYLLNKVEKSINTAKFKASTELNNLLRAAEYSYSSKDHKAHSFAEYGFDYYMVKFVVGGQMFEGRLDIGVSPQGATFYGMNKIKRVTDNSSLVLANLVLEDTQSSHRNSLNNNNISQNDTVVNNSISENDEDIKFSLKEKNTTIIEQLKQAKDKLDKMSPVIEVNENRGLKNNIDKINYAVESFEKFDYQVHREDIGKVVIDKKRAKRALGYLSNNQEILAFKAVPDVIESGIVIDTRTNHKGRQYATVTVAAPIILNGDRANVAVVISKTTDNFYKVHRVLFPDNSSIEFLENKKTGFKTIGATLNNSAHAQSGNPVNNNISQNDTVVNNSISENGENDTKFSLKEDVDKIQGVAYNNTKTLREHNEYDDFMPSGAMGKEIRNKIIQSFANKNFGNEAAIVDFYFGDYRMRVSYVSPTDYKLIDFYEIENERDGNIYAEYNGKGNDSHLQGQGNGSIDSTNDSRLSRNRGTAEEDARVSKSQFERNGGGYSGRADVHNGETEATEAEREIKKYSLLDDVEIEKAKKAYERNRKLQADTKLVRKLFKDAGTVLDRSKTDAIADTLAKRYEVKDAKLKNLLKDKLYAYYTYVASEDANDAQIALYGHEIAQDIAAMSEEITENPSDNFFEEYGESIYDVISLDVAREYAEKAIIKAPKDLEQEHKEILREYRKLKDSGDDTKAIYKELKGKTDELVKARKQYVKSRSEVMELRELLRKTQRAYERKIEKRGALTSDTKRDIIKTRTVRTSVKIPDGCKYLRKAETNFSKFKDTELSVNILKTINKTIEARAAENSDFVFDEIKVAKFPQNDKSVFITNLESRGPIKKTQLYLNKNYFLNISEREFNLRCLEHFESKWWKSKSLEDLVNHEIMHARINYYNSYEKVERLYQTLREDDRVKGFCRLVDLHPDEFMNEMYVALKNNGKIEQKYINVYLEYCKEFLRSD